MPRLQTISRLFRNRLIVFAGISLFFVLLFVSQEFMGFSPFIKLEYFTEDLHAQYGKKSVPDPRLIFLGIDRLSISLDHLSNELIAATPALRLMKASWPWSRQVYGMALEHLAQAGAKVVVFDLVFPTPSPSDAALKQTLDRYSDRVVIGCHFVTSTDDQDHRSTLVAPASTIIDTKMPMDDRVGHINFFSDSDDVIRRTQYRLQIEMVMGLSPIPGSEIYESLSARALRKAQLVHLIPPDLNEYRFRYCNPCSSLERSPDSKNGFEPISLHKIFLPDEWKIKFKNGEFFRDKIVLIGPDEKIFHDEAKTPFGIIPGPQIQLNALNAALRQDFLTESGRATNLMIIVLAGFTAFVMNYCVYIPLNRLLIFLIINSAYMTLLFLLYNEIGLFIAAVGPLCTFNGSGFLGFIYESTLMHLEKAQHPT